MASFARALHSRRDFIRATSAVGAGLAIGLPAVAEAATSAGPDAALVRRAMAALQKHGAKIPQRDLIAIADFAQSSARPRFHLLDTASGRVTTLLVSHGKGSDPSHSGYLSRFSNVNGSEASSEGAYVTGDIYVGKHGRSRRLVGLDPTNNNAYGRAIVIHGAWYVSPDIVRQHGKCGRSQGCFAVSENDLAQVLDRLGSGRLLYAEKA